MPTSPKKSCSESIALQRIREMSKHVAQWFLGDLRTIRLPSPHSDLLRPLREVMRMEWTGCGRVGWAGSGWAAVRELGMVAFFAWVVYVHWRFENSRRSR